jgi:hypothetical protein
MLFSSEPGFMLTTNCDRLVSALRSSKRLELAVIPRLRP